MHKEISLIKALCSDAQRDAVRQNYLPIPSIALRTEYLPY